MRDIVLRQADTGTLQHIEQNPINFSVLAYASTGNPRTLLKTVARSPRMTAPEVGEVLRSYYRTEIWSEHSSLTEKYAGLTDLIDWAEIFWRRTYYPICSVEMINAD
jgi:hypothetical protein